MIRSRFYTDQDRGHYFFPLGLFFLVRIESELNMTRVRSPPDGTVRLSESFTVSTRFYFPVYPHLKIL